MDFFSESTIFLLLLYVPGYIFIQTVDYFLLKREKNQFEKTVQGLLASVVIFILFVLLKWQPLNTQKEEIISLVISQLGSKDFIKIIAYSDSYLTYMGILYLLLCIYSFAFACIYSIIRKTKFISELIMKVTQRDFFQKVELRFFSKSLNQKVIVTMNNGNRYLGYLSGAPDNENDNHIILSNPHFFEEDKFTQLAAESVLIDATKTLLIEVLK